MVIINGCVHLGTDIFNQKDYSLTELQISFLSASTICPFMFESDQTFQIVGRTYQVKRRQRKRNKKEGEKAMWGGIGRKERKKRKKKRREKEVNERKGGRR